MQLTGLLHTVEHSAFDILMKDAYEGGDYQHMVFDVGRGIIAATNGYVMLELRPSETLDRGIGITSFLFESNSQKQVVPLTKNLHIPWAYVSMLGGIGAIKLHYTKHALTGEEVPSMVEMSDYEYMRTIRIEDFKVGEDNKLTVKSPKTDKNLFGQSVIPQFMVYKYKKKFDAALEKLNKNCPYSMLEDITSSIGETEREYSFYLVTKTPLLQH